MTTEARPHPARGPVRAGERALAPDLARGAMLLIIALANGANVFFATAPGIDKTPHGFDRFYNVFLFLFVHARGIPLFAIMFGYGLVQFARRQQTAGASPAAVRRVLVRRNGWLFAFGAVHGVLLFRETSSAPTDWSESGSPWSCCSAATASTASRSGTWASRRWPSRSSPLSW
ncbi:MAG TPA: hypothetical protein VGL02_07930 [Streptomyces sp.]